MNKKTSVKTGKNIEKLIMIAIAIFVFYPPYFRGLYFEDEQFIAQIFAFFLMSTLFIYKFVVPGRKFFRTPLDYAFFALVIIYVISILYAVNIRNAISEALKYIMYFACYYIVSELFREYRYKVRLIWVVVASTIGVCIISLDGALGAVKQMTYGPISVFLNNLLGLFGLKSSFFDVFIIGKIYSTLQYSNAFAAWAMSVFFLCIALVINAKSIMQRAWAGGASVVVFTSMLFAQSRGVMLLIPFVFILFVLTTQRGVRWKSASQALALMFVSVTTFLVDYPYVMSPENNTFKLWAVFVLGILTGAGGSILIERIGIWIEGKKDTSATVIENWTKGISVSIAVIALLGVVAISFLGSVSEPIKLSHNLGEHSDDRVIKKSLALKPGGEYLISVYVQGDIEEGVQDKNTNAYFVKIYNQSLRDIITDKKLLLTNTLGSATQGKERVELKLKIPDDSKNVVLELGNHFSGTSATFYSAEVQEKSTGMLKSIVLKYKYFPEEVVNRFENLQAAKSYVERSIFNKDGFELFKDSWINGYGGGAWEHLYASRQSYLYWTTQAHNYFLQLGIETGIMGILAFGSMIIIVLIMFISEYALKRKSANEWQRRNIQTALFASILGLILHSAVDFDLSLSSVYLFLSVMLGLFNNRYDADYIGDIIDYKSRILNSVIGLVRRLVFDMPKFNINALVIAIVFALLITVPALLYNASVYAEQGKVFAEAGTEWGAAYYKKAVKLDPFNAEYRNGYVDATLKTAKGFDEEILKDLSEQLAGAARYAKYDVNEITKVGTNYFAMGEFDKALEQLKRATELRPRRKGEWSTYLNAYSKAIHYLVQDGKRDEGFRMANQAMMIPQMIIDSNKTNLDPFELGALGMQNLEQIGFALENPERANEMGNVVFYSLKNSIDMDLDGAADQWESKNADKENVLRTRNLELAAGGKYTLEIIPRKVGSGSTYKFSIEGVVDDIKMTGEGNALRGQINIPAEYDRNDAFLRIITSDGSEKPERVLIIQHSAPSGIGSQERSQ